MPNRDRFRAAQGTAPSKVTPAAGLMSDQVSCIATRIPADETKVPGVTLSHDLGRPVLARIERGAEGRLPGRPCVRNASAVRLAPGAMPDPKRPVRLISRLSCRPRLARCVPGNPSMASSLACGHERLRIQATVPRMQRERVGNLVTRRSVRVILGSDDAGSRRATFDEGILAVCFLVLVAVVVLGGLLMLFQQVSATLPSSLLMTCPEFDGCSAPTPGEQQEAWVDDPRFGGPKMTP